MHLLLSFSDCLGTISFQNKSLSTAYLIWDEDICPTHQSNNFFKSLELSWGYSQLYSSLVGYFIKLVIFFLRCWVWSVLICLSLINDFEHLLTYLLAIHIYSLKKCPFKLLAYFNCYFSIIKMWEAFIHAEYKFFISHLICKSFLALCDCVFTFFTVSFEVQKFLILVNYCIYL